MKNIICIVLLFVFLASCSKNQIEQSLEKYVVDRGDGIDLNYKLEKYYFIDTLTVKKITDSLSLQLAPIVVEPDLADFKKKRNQEFRDYRYDDLDYEEKIMSGELKDASEWCTEIRIITERADSIIAAWDKVNKYSYDYNYLFWWYMRRTAEFYDFDYKLSSDINQTYDMIIENKEKFDLYNSLVNSSKDSIVEYVVSHEYSIYNPLIKSKVEQVDNVYFDSNMRYKYYQSTLTLNDIIKQFVK